MENKTNPLTVLLTIKETMDTIIDDDLVKRCYELQSKHQYDKDRDTMNKMRKFVEEAIDHKDEGNLK
ncbi:MAG: hypothetical protein OXD32_08285 [Endozoicomonadaceae bacterium]|nr:hypothetical protein [Endozoicomonadaceae bacterium]